MKNYFFLFIAAVCFTTVSCTNDKDELMSIENVKDVTIVTSDLSTRSSAKKVLKFKDQATFDRYVAEQIEVKGYVSLLNYYENALAEAEEYYDRPGGYEEFKEKYSALYFPELENDISAYLPVSDKAIAAYLNEDGFVIIGDEVKNMININTVADLKEFDLLFPEEDINNFPEPGKENEFLLTRASETSWMSATTTFHGGDRRIWIKTGYLYKNSGGRFIIKNNYKCNHVEVSFRKKGFLGQWYNYSSTTILKIPKFSNGFIPYENKKSGTSSHDYYVPYAKSDDILNNRHRTWGTVEYVHREFNVYLRSY